MNRSHIALTRRIRGTLLTVTVVATAATGLAWAATSAAPATTTTAETSTATLALTLADSGLRPSTDGLPSELRADLRQLRGMDPQQREKEATRIWQAALAGDYGTRVQLRAEQTQRRYWLLPQQLRDDLGELRGSSEDELRAGLVEIRDKALDGDYGDQVRRWAERRTGIRQED